MKEKQKNKGPKPKCEYGTVCVVFGLFASEPRKEKEGWTCKSQKMKPGLLVKRDISFVGIKEQHFLTKVKGQPL